MVFGLNKSVEIQRVEHHDNERCEKFFLLNCNFIEMKILITSILFFWCMFSLHAQDWRHVKNKKVYTDLEEAIRNSDDVYNLEIYDLPIKERLSLIGKMRNLQFLAINSEGLDSLPAEIFVLQNLRTLSLTDNEFTEIPSGIAKLSRLEYLVMYDNKIKRVPSWIGQLKYLETLILPRNEIDNISPEIKHLTKLKDLSIGANKLKHLPNEIIHLTSLEELSIGENEISYLPEGISNLKKLVYLDLGSNKFERLPARIGELVKIRNLNISRNLIKELPATLSNLHLLQEFYLYENPLSSSISQFVFPISIEILEFSGKDITSLPPSLQYCEKLSHLEIAESSIGEIPEWIGNMKNLEWLFIEKGKIKTIPNSIAELKKLKVLRFSENNIDSMPPSFYSLTNLEGFSISNNPVRHISDDLIKLKKLKWLSIYDTKITYDEYKKLRKILRSEITIAHDKPFYYEDETKPCYTDMKLTGNDDEDKIFKRMEVEPYFFGGYREWVRFLNIEKDSFFIINSFSSRKNVSEDSVILKFIVRREGGIGNIEAIHFSNEKLKEEAMRLLEKSCVYWIPALNGGRNLNAWHVQKFTFRLSNDNRGISVLVIPDFNYEPKWIAED